jgi:hypothetical protein
MYQPDHFNLTGIKAFLGPVLAGGVCCLAATAAARFMTTKPWPKYFYRLGLMAFFTCIWWLIYIPMAMPVGIKPSDTNEHLALATGFSFGCETMLAWWAGMVVGFPLTHSISRTRWSSAPVL